MIYVIKNGQKIPLGSQCDNSWNIEYDRDLASQLEGKSEWTATEDCWFQLSVIWNRVNTESDLTKIDNTTVTLNGIDIQKKAMSRGTTGNSVYILCAEAFLKKGDVVKWNCDVIGNSTFIKNTFRVFPIHKSLITQTIR